MAAERTADPEAETRLEGAKERLQQAPDPTPAKREKAPASYHVFMQILTSSDPNGIAGWSQLTADPVTAPNRKQAIIEAIASAPARREEKATATFWAVPADQFQPLKPKPRQTTIYDWV